MTILIPRRLRLPVPSHKSLGSLAMISFLIVPPRLSYDSSMLAIFHIGIALSISGITYRGYITPQPGTMQDTFFLSLSWSHLSSSLHATHYTFVLARPTIPVTPVLLSSHTRPRNLLTIPAILGTLARAISLYVLHPSLSPSYFHTPACLNSPTHLVF